MKAIQGEESTYLHHDDCEKVTLNSASHNPHREIGNGYCSKFDPRSRAHLSLGMYPQEQDKEIEMANPKDELHSYLAADSREGYEDSRAPVGASVGESTEDTISPEAAFSEVDRIYVNIMTSIEAKNQEMKKLHEKREAIDRMIEFKGNELNVLAKIGRELREIMDAPMQEHAKNPNIPRESQIGFMKGGTY